MPEAVRTARIFISSTFRDMHAERDYLVRYVFPELGERCRSLNVRLVPLDLRWGVTEEEAEQGKALEICLDEIDRARPFFVGLFGERYGWVPDRYETADHARFDWLKDPDLPGHSITALEVIHGVLRHERQRSRSFFYFRDPSFSSQVPEQLRADFAAEGEEAREKLERLKARIRGTCADGQGQVREYTAAFGGVAGDGSVVVTGLERPFGEQVLEDLWGAIQTEFPLVEESRDELDRERGRHLAFMAERTRIVSAGTEAPARIFIGREEDLRRLMEYVERQDKEVRPLVVVGRSGCGKTSLLAELAARLERRSPDFFVVPVFSGLTPASRPVGDVLERITAELGRHYGLEAAAPAEGTRTAKGISDGTAGTAEERIRTFQGALWKAAGRAGEKGSIVIFIDAADQMLDTGEGGVLSWLPPLLPSAVKIVVSVAEDAPAAQAARVRQLLIQPLAPLTADEAALAVQRHLEEHRKQLGFDTRRGVDQLQLLLRKADIALPLYLSAACEELRVHPRFETLTAKIESLPGGVTDLLDTVLERIEADHGAGLTSNALALIACSGEGLTEPELLPLLSGALGRPVPAAHWAPLRRSLAAYLRGTAEEEGGRYFFFHRLIERAARRRYLADRDAEERTYGLLADQGLHELDRTLALTPEEQTRQTSSPLFVRVGYALFKAGRDTALVETLLRILSLDDDRWASHMPILKMLVTGVEEQEQEQEPLAQRLAILSQQLEAGPERAKDRLARFLYECGEDLRKSGSSLLAERLLRIEADFASRRVAAEPERGDLRRDLAASLNSLGTLAREAGRGEEARQRFEASLPLSRALQAAGNSQEDAQYDVAITLTYLGRLAEDAGQTDAARLHYAESLEILNALRAIDASNCIVRAGISACLSSLGRLAFADGRSDDARHLFEEDLESVRSLVAGQAPEDSNLRSLSVCLNNLGNLARAEGRMEDARRFYVESLDVMRLVVATSPHRFDHRQDLSISLNNLAKLDQEEGNVEEALHHSRESLEVMRVLVEAEPHRADLRRDLSVSLNNAGHLALTAGLEGEAHQHFLEDLVIVRILADAEPGRADLRHDLAISLDNLGRLEAEAGRVDEAWTYYEESLALMRVPSGGQPLDVEQRRDLSTCLSNFGHVAFRAGRPDDARRLADESHELLRGLVTEEPGRADFTLQLASSCWSQFRLSTSLVGKSWLLEARGLLERLREQGFESAQADRLWQLVTEQDGESTM